MKKIKTFQLTIFHIVLLSKATILLETIITTMGMLMKPNISLETKEAVIVTTSNELGQTKTLDNNHTITTTTAEAESSSTKDIIQSEPQMTIVENMITSEETINE
jgi:hypothetical protein